MITRHADPVIWVGVAQTAVAETRMAQQVDMRDWYFPNIAN
ncbi:hypothetical protein [Marivita sp. S0852]